MCRMTKTPPTTHVFFPTGEGLCSLEPELRASARRILSSRWWSSSDPPPTRLIHHPLDDGGSSSEGRAPPPNPQRPGRRPHPPLHLPNPRRRSCPPLDLATPEVETPRWHRGGGRGARRLRPLAQRERERERERERGAVTVEEGKGHRRGARREEWWRIRERRNGGRDQGVH
jgi:hypothetical protein